MASGKITLSYTTTSNGATSATVRVTMTYYGNGETWNSSPSSNNCYITLNGQTQRFTHAYTTSTSAQTMGSVDFTISKSHNTQSLTTTGGITNYSTYYSDPTGSCTVSVSAKTSYTVSYNGNSNTGGTVPSNQTKWYGESLTLATNSLTRTGYTANGWNTNNSGSGTSYNNGASYTTNAALSLYAKWSINSYTLTANANNGSIPSTSGWTGTGTTATKSITYGSTYGTLPTPTRTNYNFLGWFTEQTGGTQVTSSTTMGTSPVTIYAHWQQAYIASTVTNVSAYRCNSSGTAQDDGTYGYLTFKVNRYSNGSSYSYPTTVSAVYGSNSTSITLSYTTDTTNNIRTYTSSPFSGLSVDGQYNITISITDSTYGSYTVSTFISPAAFAIDINETGTGIGFLTSAPSSGINIGNAINGLGTAGKTASGVGGIAVGARASSYTITSAGSGAIALGYAASANISATKPGSFAGGYTTGAGDIIASGNSAFAFGQGNDTKPLTASGNGAIAMGLGCTASGTFALAHNMYTTAAKRAQTTIGTWNIEDNNSSTHPAGTGGSGVTAYGKYAFIIGNGTSDSARSNAFAVTWNGKVELNSEPLFKWTQIGSGSNATSKITFTSNTTNFSEIMVVASTERNGGYHLFSGILPATIIDSTDREFKLSGGVGATASTTCGAWGKIVTTGFTPVGVWINSTAFTSTTTWRIYGR